jgi:hypothetical protein
VFRIFLLSPPNCAGLRAQALLGRRSRTEMAARLATEGAPLGEVSAYLSSLYFRGKLAYASAFGQAPAGCSGQYVITPDRGLICASTRITLEDLHAFSQVPIDLKEPRYVQPLVAGASSVREQSGDTCEVVLLGSVATGKYVECLLPVFGERLLFPAEFVGRGDMSRGGLMLRCVAAGTELAYIPVRDAMRHGKRPPKLGRL